MATRRTTREPFAIVPAALLADRSLSGTDVRVYAVLAEAANYATKQTWPSHRTVGDRAGGLSRRTVQRSIDQLVQAGWVRVESRSDESGRQTSNLYTVVHEDSARMTPRCVTDDADPAPQVTHKQDPEDRDPDTFAEFWSHAVRKVGKANARTAFAEVSDPEEVIDRFAYWCRYWTESGIDPQYIPHPATWLRQRRWEDDLPELPKPEPDPNPYAHHKVYVADRSERDATVVPIDELRRRLQ